MNTKDYLEQSARTVADNNDVKINSRVMYTVFHEVFYAGILSDKVKRTLFYKDLHATTRLMDNTMKGANILSSLEEASDISLSEDEINMLHAILGLASETGELLEELIQAKLEGREVNKENFKEEAGDLMWYLALLMRTVNTSFEEAGEANIAKLAKRYPEKFTTEKALNRDLDAEMKALQS